jgi:CHASE2 domain-containing sensor protein
MSNSKPKNLLKAIRRIDARTWVILLVSIATSILVFALATIHLLNVFLLEDSVQTRSVRYMRNFVDRSAFDGKTKIILIPESQQSDGPFGDIDKKHREFFANLVTAMAQARAKLLAFDMAFEGKSAFDAAFGNAIALADKNNLKVIVGVDSYTSGQTDPVIPSELNKPRWGTILVGGYQGDSGPISSMKLAEPDNNPGSPVIPSLALRIVMETVEPPLVAEFDRGQQNLLLYSASPNRQLIKSIPLERQRNLFLDQIPEDEIGRARIEARKVFDEVKDPDVAKKYEGAIVLVGYEQGEARDVMSGGKRLGVELHATAVSNILHDAFIYKLGPGYNYLLILLMAFLGASLHTSIGKWLDFKVPIPIPKTQLTIQVPLGLIMLGFLYLIAAFLIYKLTKMYLDVCYHLAALALSYLAIWFVLTKWFQPKTTDLRV